ncbi:MAG: hypothetical protein SCH70_13860 [Candidatus Methanoperedens sp.]|nr:hypothetical protein [Candidatus Methanoperedens sp.]
MGKFLVLWKMDKTMMPESPVGQMELFSRLMAMVREDNKSGMVDWGEFIGGNAGYCIVEGTAQELALDLMKYNPYVRFKVYPTLSVDQVEENMKAISKA